LRDIGVSSVIPKSGHSKAIDDCNLNSQKKKRKEKKSGKRKKKRKKKVRKCLGRELED
jgi:hypothetical protein